MKDLTIFLQYWVRFESPSFQQSPHNGKLSAWFLFCFISHALSESLKHCCFDLVWRWMSCVNKVHSFFFLISWPWATFSLIASSSTFNDSEVPMIVRYVEGPVNQTKRFVWSLFNRILISCVKLRLQEWSLWLLPHTICLVLNVTRCTNLAMLGSPAV